ncbi:MAG: hypothetical protein KUG68_11790 [Flavobacteriaceae bacterium]|nr:hypothetical protein [Flavobacteriaceae bacterium]
MRNYLLILLSVIISSCINNDKKEDSKPQINTTQINTEIKAKIDFLNKEKSAIAILDETYEPFFSKLQIREISAFTNEKVPTNDIQKAREFARSKFSSAVTNFSEAEKKCITFVLQKVTTILEKEGITLMTNHPWNFIKIEDWLCGGFAHTRGNYIILSQKHLDHLNKGWSDNMTPEEELTLVKNLGSLLVHEQMHSLQRSYPKTFENLYANNWNFIKATVADEDLITINQVSNPDAPIANWLIQNNDELYWVRTLLKEENEIPIMGRDFIDNVFTIENSNGIYSVKKDSNEILILKSISDIDFYPKSFPTNRGLDHPNEISAYMFSMYFEALVSESIPFKNVEVDASKNAKSFVNWIDKEMN